MTDLLYNAWLLLYTMLGFIGGFALVAALAGAVLVLVWALDRLSRWLEARGR